MWDAFSLKLSLETIYVYAIYDFIVERKKMSTGLTLNIEVYRHHHLEK